MSASTNPVLVSVTRNPAIESFHRGAIVVIDGDGKSVLELGDTSTPVFPRSAVKAIQALPLVESGTADAFGFGPQEISLACSSHSGQPAHIELVRQMLSRASISENALECGGHWSLVPKVMREQARNFSEAPSAIWNNCSGKHAGFLCTAAQMGWSLGNYVNPDHAVQQEVRAALEQLTEVTSQLDICGTDGCSIPTYAIPLKAMALGFARMVTGNGLEPQRALAAKRILTSCMEEPFFTAGDDRFCTRLMQLEKGRLFGKTGAEGVYCAAIPELGVGIALKCDDGSSRGSEAMLAATISHLLPEDDSLQPALASLAGYAIRNWNGRNVGSIIAELPTDHGGA